MDKCFTEGWWYSETSGSLYYAANKLRSTFDQCSPAVKNTLFHACCMLMYACQLWSKYTQTIMKHLHRLLWSAYNAYQIMHYTPRNASVRPYQVSHCVRTFHALLRNIFYQYFIRRAFSSNSSIWSLLMSDVFYKFSFFLNYSISCMMVTIDQLQ